MRYLTSRLLQSLLVLVGVSVLSFLFVDLAPGNFFDEMKLNPQISSDTVSHLRKQYGMDEPLPGRYWRWVVSSAQGEMGFSFAYNAPVAPLLLTRARNTLLLTLCSTLMAWMLALPMGMISAGGRRPWFDGGCTLLTTFLLTIPDLALALGLLLLAVRTQWFHVGGMMSSRDQQQGWHEITDVAAHLILPCTALALGSLPILFRHVRAAVSECLGSPYIRAAQAHGISSARILFRHVLPVAANPLVSLFGLSLGSLLGASLLVEVVMSWPGMGPLLVEAILARDIYVVIGAVMVSTIFVVLGTLIADLLLLAADPRIRSERLA